MHRPMFLPILLTSVCITLAPSTSFAQQSFSFQVGGFIPKGEDARSRDDVLVANLSGRVNDLDFLALDFDISDFNGPTGGGEWLVALNNHLEAGLGLGIYSKTSNAVYRDVIDPDGTEIETDLKLRIVPFTAAVRFMPIGRYAPVVPYVGAGVGVFLWRYVETGEFVDEFAFIPFRDTLEKTGISTGPLFLGGARVPFGVGSIGFEIRYQEAKGDLPSLFDVSADASSEIDRFVGSEIDLGGFLYLATLGIGF